MIDIITSSDLSKLPHSSQVRFAIFCAESVAHLVPLEHKQACDAALDTVRAWLDSKATAEECRAAADAATYTTYTAYANAAYAYAYAANAANAAANAAAYTAAYAANAAANAAAYAAAEDKQALIRAQWAYYRELLAFETIIEDVVLA